MVPPERVYFLSVPSMMPHSVQALSSPPPSCHSGDMQRPDRPNSVVSLDACAIAYVASRRDLHIGVVVSAGAQRPGEYSGSPTTTVKGHIVAQVVTHLVKPQGLRV